MKSKLHVGNMSFSTEEFDLEKLFSKLGTVVSVDIVKDQRTGRNNGSGFVEMKNQQEAAAVLKEFNGADFKGRKMKINLAKDKN